MAQLDELNVKIQADVKQLIAGLDNATKGMKDFAVTGEASLQTLGDAYKALERRQKEFIAGSGEFKQYSAAMQQVGNSIAQVKASATKDFTSIKTGSSQAGAALTDLGRVAQDAPFGFVGIANNLNPLIESFGRLKAETGSGKAALSALAGSLTGAGGLGVAFSLLTSALTFASVGFGAWTRGFDNANKKAEEGKNKLEEYKKTVEDIAKSVSSETTQITSLVAVIESETASRNRKKDALQQLQKLQPEIFNGLKLEGEAVMGLDIAYQKYISNLNTVIAAKIKQKQIEDITTKILEKQGATLTKSEKDLQNAFKIDPNKLNTDAPANLRSVQQQIFIKQKEEEAKKQRELNSLYKDQKALFEDLKDLQKGIEVDSNKDENVKKVKDYRDIIAELRKEILGLDAQFQSAFISKFEFDDKKVQAYGKAIKELGEIKAPPLIIGGLSNEIIATQISVELQKGVKLLEKEKPLEVPIPIELKPKDIKVDQSDLDNRLKLYSDAIKLGVKIPINFSLVPVSGNQDEIANEVLKQSIAQAEQIKQIYQNSLTNAFSGIGEALGKAFTGGNLLEGMFTGLFQTIGDGLASLGKKMIETFVLLKILKNSFNTLNPAAGLIAGIALVALGTAMKGIKIGNNANGTDNWRGGLTWVGEKGPELVNLPRGSSVIPNNESMAGGIDGGLSSQIFIPEYVLRGADLVVSYKRATATNNRNS